jgi:hypothetical protein
VVKDRVSDHFAWSRFLPEATTTAWPAFHLPLLLVVDANRFEDGSHNSRVSAFRNRIEGNMASGRPSSIRKASPHSAKLIESYCVACGLLIAASPRRRILTAMEKLHECPVYFHYEQPLKRAS